jgi:ribosomal protein L4
LFATKQTEWIMQQDLNNKEYIFALLTALVKRANGELRITEGEILNVFSTDIVTLLWDEEEREIVLQTGVSDLDYTTVPDKNSN